MDFGVGTRKAAFDLVEVDDGNFDYNDKVMVEVSQKQFRDFWIRPVGGVVNQSGPHHFTIDPTVDRYLQLNRAALEIKARVVRSDGTDMNSFQDVVAPVNLLGAVMWEQVDVTVNGQSFPGASSINSGYKAYIETLLSYDSDARNTHLNSQFFHLDSPYQFGNMKASSDRMKKHYVMSVRRGRTPQPAYPADMMPLQVPAEDMTQEQFVAENQNRKRQRDAFLVDNLANVLDDVHKMLGYAEADEKNRGYDARWAVVSGSTPFDMYCPITHDFFKMNNHVGPGNRIDIKLSMYPHNFLLNTYLEHEGFKLQIDDMRMHLHTIERKERVPSPMIERYLMSETQMHKQVVPQGLVSYQFRAFNGGVMPKTIIVAMGLTTAVEGNYAYNPFNFHHFGLSKIALIINGETYPSKGLEMDFTTQNAMVSRAYHWMFENTGSVGGDKGNIVSWPAFQGGCFLIPFDLTPDKCNGIHNHNGEYGAIDIEFAWSTQLPAPITVLYELVFPKVVINDKLNSTLTVLDIEA